MAARNPKLENIHFFKPLLPGFQRQLAIPKSFYVKYLEDKRAEKAVLRTEMGKHWHVKLNGKVIFDDGWEEFCEEEELKVGYFLVFGLVEAAAVVDLVFDVLVFDLTTCTRDYPCLHNVTEETPEEEEEEIPNESAGENRKKEKDANFERKDGSFVPQHPYFVFNLSSYAAKSAILYIPKKFAQENGLYNRNCDIVLVNERGKKWLAGLGFYPQRDLVHIKGSWYAFCRANSLKAGDSCILELIRRGDKPVVKLTKCPEGFKPNPYTKRQPPNNAARDRADSWSRKPFRNLRKKEKDANFEQKSGFYVPQHPYFELNLSSYSAKSSILCIPTNFARENGLYNRSCDIVLVNEKGKEWLAGLGFYPERNVVHIKRTWIAFRSANSLKAGDSCIFELIQNGEKPVLKLARCPQWFKPSPKAENQQMNDGSQDQAGSWLIKPQVHVTVKPYHFRLCILRIPTAFAVKSGFERKIPEEIIIRNERDQSWAVSIWKSKTGSINLGHGWIAFARSNGIEVGDVLKLELIKKGNNPVVRISGVPRTNKNYRKINQKNSSESVCRVDSVEEMWEDVKPLV